MSAFKILSNKEWKDFQDIIDKQTPKKTLFQKIKVFIYGEEREQEQPR